LITLIKQTEEEGIVTNFWTAANREGLYSKLNFEHPDPNLKAELTKDGHIMFEKSMTPIKIGDTRYTLMCDVES